MMRANPLVCELVIQNSLSIRKGSHFEGGADVGVRADVFHDIIQDQVFSKEFHIYSYPKIIIHQPSLTIQAGNDHHKT